MGDRQMTVLSLFHDEAFSSRVTKHEIIDGKGDIDYTVIPAEMAEAVIQYYSLPTKGFGMILVGKDATVKERYTGVTTTEPIFGYIDGMTMRKREMVQEGPTFS